MSREHAFPLTDLQQAYLLGRNPGLELGRVAAASYLELEFDDIPPDRIRDAWRRLVEHHDMLRAVFLPDGTQRILRRDEAHLEIAVRDLREVGDGQVADALEDVRRRLSRRLAEVGAWPLFEVEVSRLPGGRTRLHCDFDHLLGDAHSLTLLIEQFRALLEQPDLDLGPARPTFRDVASRRKSAEPSALDRRARESWTGRLEEMPDAPRLPYAKEFKAVGVPHFTRRRGGLDVVRRRRLAERADAAGLTVAQVLAAVYAEVLAEWSRTPRFTIPVATFERSAIDPPVDRIVGDFTRLTLLAVDARSAPSFVERARCLRDRWVEDLAHGGGDRDYGAVRVLRDLARRRGRPPGAWMPVVFTDLLAAPPVPGIVHALSRAPQVALDCRVFADGDAAADALAWAWDAVDELFPPGLLDAMLAAFGKILTELADAEESWSAAAFELRPAAQVERVARINAVASPGEVASETASETLHGLFAAQVAARGDAPAVISETYTLSYRRLDDLSLRAAAWLRARGAKPGMLVGLVLEKGWEQAVAALGVLRSGAAYLPIDPAWPADRRALVLADGGVELVLTQPRWDAELEWPPGVERLALNPHHLEAQEPLAASPDDPLAARPDDLAYVIFTSGSTGAPKGVAIEHRAVVNTLLDVNARFAVGPEDRVLALSDLTFDLSVYDLFGTLAAGGAVVLPEAWARRDPSRWGELLEAYGVSVWNSVPALLEMLIEHAESRSGADAGDRLPDIIPGSLRLVLLSGDWLPLDIADRLRALRPGVRLVALGGATEASIWSILHAVEEVDPAWPSIPYGKPMRRQSVWVLDDRLRPRPDLVPGDLYIGGAGLARQLWRDVERTARAFVEHPGGVAGIAPGTRLYRTGDLGRWLADGSIEFLGRDDAQVKVREHRIELGEVEAALLRVRGVAAAVVTAPCARRVDGGRGPRTLVGWIVPERGAEQGQATRALDHDLVRHRLGSVLPAHMVPSSFAELEDLPRTAHGKVDRAALEAHGVPVAAATSSIASHLAPIDAPRTPVEHRLAEIWRDLLGVDRVGREDHLFELGGDSLPALELVRRIRESFGLELPLGRILERPTVVALAEALALARLETPDAASHELLTLVPDTASRHAPFPLGEVQEAYWVGRFEGLELGNVAAHHYTEVENLPFGAADLERALNVLIRRHDALRLVIDGNGTQRILPADQVAEYAVRVQDLRGEPAEVVERGLAAWREELSDQVLAVDRWPIFEVRASLYAAPDGREILRAHFSFDLLISDPWSLRIFFRELARIACREPGEDAHLPELEISFRDYVLAERVLAERVPRGGELAARSWAYWKERLAVLPPAPELPTTQELPAAPEFRRREARLARPRWERLQARAAALGLTPTGLLLAAFSEILAAWAKTPHFTLNLTTFERLPLHPQVGDLMGDFTRLTLVEVDLGDREPFALHARRIQERIWQDHDHRYINGVTVTRELAKLHGTPGAALMPVVFTSRLFRAEGFDKTGESRVGDAVYSVSQTPQVWLDHQATDEDEDLLWSWDVVEEIFPEGVVDAMFATYGALLERLADGDAIWRQPPASRLLTDQPPFVARRRESGEPGEPAPRPLSGALLHRLALAHAEERPSAPAVIAPGRVLSHGDLATSARRVGHWLREHGARPETLVAVVMEKGWEQVVGVLGVLSSGAAYLPIDPDVPAERLAYLLDNGGVRLVLTQSWIEGRLRRPKVLDGAGIQILAVDRAAFDAALPAPEMADVQTSLNLAYVIFTSGSTGRPKGVAIEHRGAVNTILDINRRYAIGPGDRVLALSELNFDLSVYDIFGILAAGGALVLPRADAERDPSHWAGLVRNHRVTVWNSVPQLLEMLVESCVGRELDAPLGPSPRLALLSGDWIPTTLPGRARGLAPGWKIVSLGGATEASIWSILYEVDEVDPAWRSIPYGKAMAGQSFHVLGEGFAPRPTWAVGELFIGGVGLAREYWRDPEKTAASFRIHPATGERLYRTGDLGRYLPDGNIEFLGREDAQVKVQGFRIELGEIEAAMSEFPEVGVAVVSAPLVPGGDGRSRRLVGYVVPPGRAASRFGELASLGGRHVERLLDPARRREFRRARHGLRTDLEGRSAVPLVVAETDPASLRRLWLRRRTVRRFADGPIPRRAFGHFLACLREIRPKGVARPKSRYPSAGGLYPVRVWAAVKEGAIEGLAAGLYAYDRQAHTLRRVADRELGREPHIPENRSTWDSAGFTLLLSAPVDDPSRVDPSRDWRVLEAGYMGQLLMEEATAAGLGLCPIGRLETADVQRILGWGDGEELLHTFLGGALPESASAAPLSMAPSTAAPPPSGTGVAVELPGPPLGDDLVRLYAARRSARRFLDAPIPLVELGAWLGCLRSIPLDGLDWPKSRYPSAGGLYPVQVGLYIEPGRVEGLAGGTWAYDPVGHRLVQLHPEARLESTLHEPANRPIVERGAFTLFLFAKLGAAAPVHGERTRDFCLLEAGYMGQLLMEEAAARWMGLCPLGGIDPRAVREPFDLADDHLPVHLFVGGKIPAGPLSLALAEDDAPPLPAPSAEPTHLAAAERTGGSTAEPTAEPAVDLAHLRAFLSTKLPPHMVPPKILVLDHLPLTANGKIDRKALPLPEDDPTTAAQRPRIEPRTPNERRLAELVADLLELDEISVIDNFFELGGTSVQMIRLQRRVREQLGAELEITAIFRHPTVEALAGELDGRL